MAVAEAWLKRVFSEIDKSNAECFGNFLADDAEFIFANDPPIKGREAVIEYLAKFFGQVSGLKHQVSDVVVGSDCIVCRGRVTFVRTDDRAVECPFTNWFCLEDGLLKQYSMYVDRSAL